MRSVVAYFCTVYIFSGLLVPIYIAVLVRVYNGSKFKFIKQTAWLLLASNLGYILYGTFLQIQWENQQGKDSYKLKFTNAPSAMMTVGIMFKTIGFNVGIWTFAH